MVVFCVQVTGITSRTKGKDSFPVLRGSLWRPVLSNCLSFLLGAFCSWAAAMEKGRGSVSARPDILSLENRCLAMLPNLQPAEKPHGYMSAHPDILSLKNQCLARISDLKSTEKPHGHVAAHPDILSLENKCLSTFPGIKSSVSASSLLQRLQLSHRPHADLCSLHTSTCLPSEAPSSRTAQCLSAVETVQVLRLVIAPDTCLYSRHICCMLLSVVFSTSILCGLLCICVALLSTSLPHTHHPQHLSSSSSEILNNRSESALGHRKPLLREELA